ncbi:MAG: ABC transporter substrate-binding protein [Flavobacteriales bacterium]|nr:ABC transporter substrate-binding protein [Flavobacteriales bacterium]
MKTILKYIFVSIIGLSFYSCGEDENNQENTNTESLFGDTLKIALNQDIKELDPIRMVDGYSVQIVGQIFEGLVKFNAKDLSIEPLLAESWTIDESGLVYTFKLKKGVYFHDNKCFDAGKGRELKANDVFFSINRACNTPSANYAYNLLKNKLNGAKECYESEAINEVSGVKVIDDYSVSFTLSKPSSNFLQTLATSSLAIIPEEATKSEKLTIVGTGPFVFDNNSIKENIITLKRNNNYHIGDEKGNKLPYLDAVAFHIIPKSQDRLEQFQNKKIDIIVDLPSASIKDVVENQIADFESKPPKFVLGRYPELVSTYLEFNTKVEPFKNVKVRKAIAMAIDKVKIVDVVLNGEAYGPALNGIVPPAINNYDYASVIGIEHNIEKAKKLLAEAGFKDGEGLPLIKFFIGGDENQLLRVALEIQKQLLTELNINTEIVKVTFAEKLAMDQMAQGSMGISAWLADFPTADNFLNIGYGGYVPATLELPSFPNSSRFENSEFDSYFEQAISTIDEKKRNELILKAEQILINEAPIVPLWYNENYRLFQSNVVDYQPNVMHLHYLERVRKIAPKKQDQELK